MVNTDFDFGIARRAEIAGELALEKSVMLAARR
jgi:hypothetical protein